MEIKLRILDLHPENHSVTIRYSSDKLSEDYLASEFDGKGKIRRRLDGTPTRCRTDSHLEIRKVPAPEGADLLDYIFEYAPPNREWFELQEKILDPAVDTSMGKLVGMTTAEFLVPPAAPSSGLPRRNVMAMIGTGQREVDVAEF